MLQEESISVLIHSTLWTAPKLPNYITQRNEWQLGSTYLVLSQCKGDIKK